MATTTELLQQRFHEATAQAAAIRATAAPLRAQYEAKAQQMNTLKSEMDAIAEQFRVIEAPLFDLDNERGSINRALNGLTGTPPA